MISYIELARECGFTGEDAQSGSWHEFRAWANLDPGTPEYDIPDIDEVEHIRDAYRKARVQAGMDFLDEHCPGHVERFNPDILDLDPDIWDLDPDVLDPDAEGDKRCVLEQATGELWDTAIHRVGLAGHGMWDKGLGLGFILMSADDQPKLELAWQIAYATRRFEASTPQAGTES